MYSPLETLESRRMMSVSLSVDAATGTLQVIGSKTDDDIRVTAVGWSSETGDTTQNGDVALTEGQAETTDSAEDSTSETSGPNRVPVLEGISVYDNGELIFNSATARANITNVEIYGNEGVNLINVMTWNTQIMTQVIGGTDTDIIFTTADHARATQINSGAGDDFIQAQSGQDVSWGMIDAGEGDDQLEVLRFSDTSSINSAVVAGPGNDNIFLSVESGELGTLVLAGEGNDVIYGSARSDLLYGENGNDVIYAGAGNDMVFGGNGNDQLYGEDGDDYLDDGQDNNADLLDGGAGTDSAHSGNFDKLNSIEEILV